MKLEYKIVDGVMAFSTLRDEELPFEVLQPHQVHEDRIVVVDRRDMTRDDLEGVDALICAMDDFAIGVRTADCVPVLLYDTEHRVVAAVHSGWRGTIKRISQKTIRVMTREFGTQPENVKAVIGPSIGPDSFQVGEEVVEEFRRAGFPDAGVVSNRGEKMVGTMKGGWHIDLWVANVLLLEEIGVRLENIQVAGICTYESNDMFFSARHEGRKCGRIINVIKLLKQ